MAIFKFNVNTLALYPAGKITKGMKRCGHCKKDLEINDFYVDNKSKDGLRSWCKACVRTDNNNRYSVFDSSGRLRNRHNHESRMELKQRLIAMLGGKCKRCGYAEFVCSLEFHHIDLTKKETNIAYLLAVSKTDMGKLTEAVSKCILLCSNCHRAVHHGLANLR